MLLLGFRSCSDIIALTISQSGLAVKLAHDCSVIYSTGPRPKRRWLKFKKKSRKGCDTFWKKTSQTPAATTTTPCTQIKCACTKLKCANSAVAPLAPLALLLLPQPLPPLLQRCCCCCCRCCCCCCRCCCCGRHALSYHVLLPELFTAKPKILNS
jgi:hypothetical protein